MLRQRSYWLFLKKSIIKLFILLIFSSHLAAEEGVYDKVILVGQSAVMSGPAQTLGKEMRRGIQLYFNQINSRGGIYGRKLLLVTYDDGYKPRNAVKNTNKLINIDKVFALIGYVGTPTTKAALPIIKRSGIPFIGPFTGAELLRTPVIPNVFNVRASYYQETDALVAYLIRNNITNISVFYQYDSYGAAGLKGVELATEKRGIRIKSKGSYERNSIDISEALDSIIKTSPEAIIMIGAYSACAEFIRQAKQNGLSETQFLNISFVGSKALASDLWTDSDGVIVSQVMPFPNDKSIPVVREYIVNTNRFNPQSGVSYGSLEGYIVAKAFVKGLKKAGKDLTRKKLINAFNKFGKLDLGGFSVNWNRNNHHGSNFIEITVIGENNRWFY